MNQARTPNSDNNMKRKRHYKSSPARCQKEAMTLNQTVNSLKKTSSETIINANHKLMKDKSRPLETL